jgi:hypothetical protein
MCHRRVREMSKDCNFAREMSRVGLATHFRREKSLAARISMVQRKASGSCVGLEAMRPEVQTADRTGYSAYATPGTETCSNQRDSILQGPFSSTSVADAIGDVPARKAGEKASDAIECRVW